MLHGREIGGKRRRSKIVQRGGLRNMRGGAHGGQQGRRDALAVGLADHAEPHTGRDEIGDEGEQVMFKRRQQRQSCPAAAAPSATG